MGKISEKYNDSCLKIFALLLMLSKGDAEYSEVIKLFPNSDGKITQKSNVTLNKYMNTIKIFGVEVQKSKNKYTLLKMPFSIQFNEKDLYAINIIQASLNLLPKGKNKNNIEKILSNLQNRYDIKTKQLNAVIEANKNYDLSLYCKKYENQIAEYEQYCQDSSKIELIYAHNGENLKIICIPQEIKYLDKIVCLSVYSSLHRQIYDIPVENIIKIKKLAEHTLVKKICTTVVFKLKGSLADRYKLREWEQAEGKDENGYLTIVNSGEDFNTLASRLLRYDDKCEVISPESFREKMISIIDETIKNY